MASTDSENLARYRRAGRIADQIGKIAMTRGESARNLVGNPIVRAADGIGANLAADNQEP